MRTFVIPSALLLAAALVVGCEATPTSPTVDVTKPQLTNADPSPPAPTIRMPRDIDANDDGFICSGGFRHLVRIDNNPGNECPPGFILIFVG